MEAKETVIGRDMLSFETSFEIPFARGNEKKKMESLCFECLRPFCKEKSNSDVEEVVTNSFVNSDALLVNESDDDTLVIGTINQFAEEGVTNQETVDNEVEICCTPKKTRARPKIIRTGNLY